MYTKLNNDIETYTYDERHNRLTKRIQTGGSDSTGTYTMNIGDQLTERSTDFGLMQVNDFTLVKGGSNGTMYNQKS